MPEWMAFTVPTGLFVVAVVVGIAALAILAAVKPSVPRKGFLPMETARGDRVYISLLGTGLILVLVIAVTSWTVPMGLGIAAVWALVVMRWG